jgi:predicted DNA-binding protein (UPF0251 family)
MNTQVTLTMKEQHKLKMVIDYEAGKVRAQRAAELPGISKRQFRRLVAAYRQKGIAAMAHGNRGRVPANRISEQVQQEILRLAKETYRDYNDCHFTEELAEQSEPILVLRSNVRCACLCIFTTAASCTSIASLSVLLTSWSSLPMTFIHSLLFDVVV